MPLRPLVLLVLALAGCTATGRILFVAPADNAALTVGETVDVFALVSIGAGTPVVYAHHDGTPLPDDTLDFNQPPMLRFAFTAEEGTHTVSVQTLFSAAEGPAFASRSFDYTATADTGDADTDTGDTDTDVGDTDTDVGDTDTDAGDTAPSDTAPGDSAPK